MNQLLFLIKFGLRNLLRNPGRTLLLFLSLTLSQGFIIWSLNFSFSGSREVVEQFLKTFQGHYQVTHKDYFLEGSTRDFDFFKVISDADFDSPLQDSAPRITSFGFLSGMHSSKGVMLLGINPEIEKKFTKLADTVKVGEFLNDAAPFEILIGKRLAKKLKVNVGDEIALVGQGFDGSFANELFTVKGLFDFGGGDKEENLAFMSQMSAENFFAIPAGFYHSRFYFKETPPTISNPELSLYPWSQTVPEVYLSISLIDRFTKIISFVLILVISLGLSNSLMVSFLERDKELRTMSILGANHLKVITILGIEVLSLGAISLIAGSILGHLATLYFHYNPLDIKMFTDGKAIIMGGIELEPMIRFYPQYQYYFAVTLVILFFICLSFIIPLRKVIKRKEI